MSLLPTAVSPTGLVVYDGQPATPEWFAARREGITGTDLPKILGLTKYGNALSVWRDKRGELEDDDEMEAATWGHILEEPVAQEWARRNYVPAVARVGVIAHRDHPWIRASLDRLVLTCPDQPAPYGGPVAECGLEIKTRSAYKAGDFKDDIPDDVLAQVQWGLVASGFDHMHVAVLIGGQKLRSFRVDRDDKLEEYLREAGAKVWSAVKLGVPPAVHPDAQGILLDQLNDMFRDRAGDVKLPDKARTFLRRYCAAGRGEAVSKASKTKAKTALVQMLGDGDTGLLDGQVVFTYKVPQATDEVTSKQLARLKAERPYLYLLLANNGFVTQTNPGPRFNLRKERPTT